MQLTLRTKGVLALGLLLLYVVLIALFHANERHKLVAIVEKIESDNATQTFLTTLVNGMGRSLLETQAILSSPNPSARRIDPSHPAARNLARIGADLAQTEPLFPTLAPDIEAFGEAVAAAGADDPVAALTRIRDTEQRLIARMNAILVEKQARGTSGTEAYHEAQDRLNFITAAANLAGALASAAVILIFFTKLAKDIHRLQDRAVAVVAGYDGEPLVNTRHDEVGGLIVAVNRMQVDLRRAERKQEISRQQRFHQEKMAAVGSLAAAIGHEVSNPIAAISGVAQFILEETNDSRDPLHQIIHEHAAQIVKQTERTALIMRRMATLTDTRSPDAELLDLNALVDSTCSFIAFDPRFADIALEFDLDRTIPAVTAVPDHITQILMNLLINAADAMDHSQDSEPSQIVVSTRVAGDDIHLSVRDNGVGMTPAVRDRAFEESFTTKPTGKGRGIGLFLCKALVEQDGGRIELHSTPNAGTTVDLFLPLAGRRLEAPGVH